MIPTRTMKRVTTTILKMIRDEGYVVLEAYEKGRVELRAVPRNGSLTEIVCCDDVSASEAMFLAACQLANNIGLVA